MRAYRKFNTRGFTLVELMIVVAIIGVLAALAIYGVRRFLASAKTAEAKHTVGAIARAGVAAFEREAYNNQLLGNGSSTSMPSHVLCGTAQSRVPGGAPQGVKYQPSTTDGQDFNTGDNLNGWKCLGFSMSEPIHYSYYYTTGSGTGLSGATGAGFEASALGDLNGNAGGTNQVNSQTSFFARGADVRDGVVVLSSEIYVWNEFE